jgi:BMFP domain-containing protein YqiC
MKEMLIKSRIEIDELKNKLSEIEKKLNKKK